MRILAHNGVDHASQIEDALHLSIPTMIWIVVISAIIISFVLGASKLVKKFAKAEETVEGKKES